MVHYTSFAVAASVASLVAAAPATVEKRATLPIRKGHSSKTISAKSVVERDLARIANYNARKPASAGLESRATGSGVATNEDVSYVASVDICSTSFSLIVDTGSSNLWAGAQNSISSSCGTDSGDSFSVSYGSGSVSGEEINASVTYGGLTVDSQGVGSASSASGFTGVDGIIGFGPVDLTQGTVSGVNEVPTFMDNLYSQGSISTEVLGVFFQPESGSDTDDANGELTLGGVDTSKYTGTLTYFSTSSTSPYSYYWGIATAGLTYGSTSLESSANAIVDTGTTLIYIPTSAYNKFLKAAGGTTDSSTGLARFSSKPSSNFTIKIGSVSYPLTPAQYLVPSGQYSYYGLSSGYYYSWIGDGGSTAANVNFIIGQKFLENYYSVYDTTNSRIGFATAV